MIYEGKTLFRETKKIVAWKHCVRVARERKPDDPDLVERFPQVDQVLDDLFRKDKSRCA